MDRCKHGMVREWCTYCNPTPGYVKTPVVASARGTKTYWGDHRPLFIYHKEETEVAEYRV